MFAAVDTEQQLGNRQWTSNEENLYLIDFPEEYPEPMPV